MTPRGGITAERLLATRGPEGDKEPTEYLGWLVWYSSSDVRIMRDELEEALKKSGLDAKYLPGPINARDAFRRASTIEVDKRFPLEGNRFLNLLVREVTTGKREETQPVQTGRKTRSDNKPDELVRQVVREIVDARNRRLDYRPVAQLTLEEDGRVTTTYLTQSTDGKIDLYQQERDLLRQVVDDYKVNQEHYSGQHIRMLTKEVLGDTRPVAVRPTGGVYFVRREFEPIVSSLKTLLNDHINPKTETRRTKLYRVPVIDSEEQRANVQESLEEQVKTETKSLIEEMGEILKEHKAITKGRAQQYMERARALTSMVNEYEELLESELVGTKALLDATRQQAATLLRRVEE